MGQVGSSDHKNNAEREKISLTTFCGDYYKHGSKLGKNCRCRDVSFPFEHVFKKGACHKCVYFSRARNNTSPTFCGARAWDKTFHFDDSCYKRLFNDQLTCLSLVDCYVDDKEVADLILQSVNLKRFVYLAYDRRPYQVDHVFGRYTIPVLSDQNCKVSYITLRPVSCHKIDHEQDSSNNVAYLLRRKNFVELDLSFHDCDWGCLVGLLNNVTTLQSLHLKFSNYHREAFAPYMIGMYSLIDLFVSSLPLLKSITYPIALHEMDLTCLYEVPKLKEISCSAVGSTYFFALKESEVIAINNNTNLRHLDIKCLRAIPSLTNGSITSCHNIGDGDPVAQMCKQNIRNHARCKKVVTYFVFATKRRLGLFKNVLLPKDLVRLIVYMMNAFKFDQKLWENWEIKKLGKNQM
jgi:hypothetical protein